MCILNLSICELVMLDLTMVELTMLFFQSKFCLNILRMCNCFAVTCKKYKSVNTSIDSCLIHFLPKNNAIAVRKKAHSVNPIHTVRLTIAICLSILGCTGASDVSIAQWKHLH